MSDYLGRIITKNPTYPSPTAASGVWTLDEALQYQKAGKWPPGYAISRSVRIRQSASAYFNRTLTTPTSSQKFTLSGWTKRGKLDSSGLQGIFAPYSSGTVYGYFAWYQDGIRIFDRLSGGANYTLQTTAVYRDPSAWYHIVYAVDTTQATAANRVRLYVNGVEVTSFSTAVYPTQNNSTTTNSAIAHYIGYDPSNVGYLDGYLTEINFIDGQQLTPASFGYADTATGVWQPLPYTGTYGTNGFYLNFSDNSAATAAAIGKDYSGNGNNWTPNNISVTAGVTYDSFKDVPTPYADGSGGRGNYAVGNPLLINVTTSSTATLTNGNLLLTNGSATYSGFASTISIPTTGKWAWKFKVTGSVSGSNDGYIGFACNSSGSAITGASSGAAANWYTTVQIQTISSRSVVHKYDGGSVVTDVAGSALSGATNDEYEFLIDRGAGTTIVKLNGSNLGSTITGLTATQELFPFATFYQTSGYFVFDYTPSDTSYNPLNTQNLSTPTIANGAGYMAATTYTGNGGTQTVANSGSFAPDFVWVKNRGTAGTDHGLFDTVRGATKRLASNLTSAETTEVNSLTAFTSTGFTVGAAQDFNQNGVALVGWQWKAGGTAVTNNDGNRTASVSANTTAGFSAVTWTFSTSANNTIGHGLGVAPSFIIVKDRSSAVNWDVYHVSLGYTQRLILNTTGAAAAGYFAAAPTSTVFSMTTAAYTNNDNIVAYCFAPIAGYSAFGSYTGNGSADGTFVYTGFRPRYLMIKRTDSVGDWWMIDTSRSPYNVSVQYLFADTSAAEGSDNAIDILSNGFKLRVATYQPNTSGGTFVYAAFAENPFKYARAR